MSDLSEDVESPSVIAESNLFEFERARTYFRRATFYNVALFVKLSEIEGGALLSAAL